MIFGAMSIYLQYRIAHSQIDQVTRICVRGTPEEWVFPHVIAELANLFPKALIFEPSDHSEHTPCELVVVPYQGTGPGILAMLESIRWAASYSPTHLMFYGLTHRSVEVVSWSRLWTFWFSRAVEMILRQLLHPRQAVTRLVHGVIRRSRLQVWQQRGTEVTAR